MANSIRLQFTDVGLYRHATVMRDPDDSNALIYTLPEQLEFQPHDGMVTYSVRVPQALYEICVPHYSNLGLKDPWRSTEAVAQFQIRPVMDLSVPLRPGAVIYLPSVEWLDSSIYGDSLTEVPEL